MPHFVKTFAKPENGVDFQLYIDYEYEGGVPAVTHLAPEDCYEGEAPVITLNEVRLITDNSNIDLLEGGFMPELCEGMVEKVMDWCREHLDSLPAQEPEPDEGG